MPSHRIVVTETGPEQPDMVALEPGTELVLAGQTQPANDTEWRGRGPERGEWEERRAGSAA